MISRRAFGVGLGALGIELVSLGTAQATSAVALSLEQLVRRSHRVILGTPVAAEAHWESVAGSRRIVTTTRILQEADWLADEDESDELLVATLGGRVGDLGQKVPGEAALVPGESSVLFVSEENDGRRRVVAMGQGHYPLAQKDKLRVLRASPSIPHLFGKLASPGAPLRAQRAVDVLSGRSLESARDLIRGAR